MAKVTDPMCGMTIDSSQAEAPTIYQGQAYFFCSQECRRMFEDNPKQYTAETTAAPLRLDTDDGGQ